MSGWPPRDNTDWLLALASKMQSGNGDEAKQAIRNLGTSWEGEEGERKERGSQEEEDGRWSGSQDGRGQEEEEQQGGRAGEGWKRAARCETRWVNREAKRRHEQSSK